MAAAVILVLGTATFPQTVYAKTELSEGGTNDGNASANGTCATAVGDGAEANANAGAFGAYFQPNEDILISLGSTVGNGNTMMNAGVSFKLGRRGDVLRIKTDARTVQKLAMENAQQAKKIEKLEADNAEMKADNEKMKAQIAEILKKLELSETVGKSAAH